MKRIKIVRTERGMTYRKPKPHESYSCTEMWRYISREGGIWE